jgi:serine/threonine protein kinase
MSCVPDDEVGVVERRSKFYAGMDVMHKADMFSLGVVAFMMLSSTKPFKGSRFPEMHREVQAGLRCEGRGWGHVSSAAKALVEKMLRADPATRTSAEDVLEDPWVEEGCRRFMEVVERLARRSVALVRCSSFCWSFVPALESSSSAHREPLSALFSL